MELREVLLRDKPASLLKVSPKATVPVLVLTDGTVIDESLDVMRWALSENDPDHWLAPDSPDRQREITGLVDRIDTEFKAWLNAYKYPERHPDLAEQAPREQALAILTDLNARIQPHGYLCGSSTTIADAAWFPFVRQFAHVDRGWFYGTELKALQTWLDGWLESDLFSVVMVKHKPWKPGDETKLFPPPESSTALKPARHDRA